MLPRHLPKSTQNTSISTSNLVGLRLTVRHHIKYWNGAQSPCWIRNTSELISMKFYVFINEWLLCIWKFSSQNGRQHNINHWNLLFNDDNIICLLVFTHSQSWISIIQVQTQDLYVAIIIPAKWCSRSVTACFTCARNIVFQPEINICVDVEHMVCFPCVWLCFICVLFGII